MSTDGGQRSKENVAAGLLAVVLMGALGGLGLVLAAVAVGTERAWNGRDGGTAAGARGSWRRSLDDHRAWLAADRARVDEWRAARRKWWSDGADPATRPAQPSGARRFGAGARRWWSRMVIGTDRGTSAAGRFWRGAREGWSAAQKVRRDGGGFRDIILVRPGEVPDEPPLVTAVPDELDAQQVTDLAKTDQPADVADETSAPTQPSTAEPTNETPKPPSISDGTATTGDDMSDDGKFIENNGRPGPYVPSGEMAAAKAVAGMGGGHGGGGTAASAGETHLDLTVLGLGAINATLARVNELNDQLAAARATLSAQVAAETERVAANGGTTTTTQALDEASAVVDLVGEHVRAASDAIAGATDQVSTAEQGLRPAQDAQDSLHSAGARGEFVSTATSD